MTAVWTAAARPKTLLDVVLDEGLEFLGDVGAAQGQRLPAVDEDRCRRLLAGAGERDADVGVLGFAASTF